MIYTFRILATALKSTLSEYLWSKHRSTGFILVTMLYIHVNSTLCRWKDNYTNRLRPKLDLKTLQMLFLNCRQIIKTSMQMLVSLGMYAVNQNYRIIMIWLFVSYLLKLILLILSREHFFYYVITHITWGAFRISGGRCLHIQRSKLSVNSSGI